MSFALAALALAAPAAGRTDDVRVDAVTGKVLENGKEGANPD